MTYNKEFLIEELHRFYNENGRVPVGADLTTESGYPTIGTYQYYFKTFNKALEIAELKFNRHTSILDGTEVCSYCGKRADEIPRFRTWLYPNGKRYCEQHGYSGRGGLPDYVKKELNPKCTIGKAIVSQRVVANVLGLDLKDDCNCSISHTYPYDLYHKDKYKYINVKDSKLYYRKKQNPYWRFNLTQAIIPKTYICLGYDNDRKNILHVWISDRLSDLVLDEELEYKQFLTITNKQKGLKKAEPWEIDAKPYDDMLHLMSQKRKETKGKECVLDSSDLR